MMPNDTPQDALANALRKAFPATEWPNAPADPVDDADAILAALDGWELVPVALAPVVEANVQLEVGFA